MLLVIILSLWDHIFVWLRADHLESLVLLWYLRLQLLHIQLHCLFLWNNCYILPQHSRLWILVQVNLIDLTSEILLRHHAKTVHVCICLGFYIGWKVLVANHGLLLENRDVIRRWWDSMLAIIWLALLLLFTAIVIIQLFRFFHYTDG